MPGHIPPAADGVAATSNTLADVAIGIAEEEYGDYPEIQQPILDAAKDVRSSAANLVQAIHFLTSNSDRNKGWAGLLEACRTISGHTVYILQLVYGAELQRLLLSAEHARDLASQISSDTAAKNPQLFADQVSELAGHAEALASFLEERATKEEESPLAKERQQKTAAALAKISQELPELANNVLKSPQDVKARKTFDDKVRELEKELEVAAAPVREKLALQPTKSAPLGSEPTKPTPAAEKPRPAQSAIGKSPIPVDSRLPPEPTEIPRYANRAKEVLHNLSAAAANRDVPGVTKEVQSLVEAVAPLVDSLERLGNDSADPERKRQIKQVTEGIKKQVPKAVAASANEVKEPKKNNTEQPQAVQQLEKLIEAAKSIGRPAPEIEISAAARNVAADLPALVIAAERGDPKATEEAAKRISSLTPKIGRHLKEFVEKPVHPLKKAQAADTAKKLDLLYRR